VVIGKTGKNLKEAEIVSPQIATLRTHITASEG